MRQKESNVRQVRCPCDVERIQGVGGGLEGSDLCWDTQNLSYFWSQFREVKKSFVLCWLGLLLILNQAQIFFVSNKDKMTTAGNNYPNLGKVSSRKVGFEKQPPGAFVHYGTT